MNLLTNGKYFGKNCDLHMDSLNAQFLVVFCPGLATWSLAKLGTKSGLTKDLHLISRITEKMLLVQNLRAGTTCISNLFVLH